MKKTFFLVAAIILCIASATAQRKPYFDTSRPDRVLTFGLRAGLNSSGLANNYLSIQPNMIQDRFYWRMGGQIGGIVDLHIRNYFAIETGIFWENHGFDCAAMAADSSDDYMGSVFLNSRFNYLHFPVMLSFRLNLLPGLTGQLDLGAYYAYGICGKKKQYTYMAFADEGGEMIFDKEYTKTDFFGASDKDLLAVRKSDIGAKAGIAFTLRKHYFLGVYYQKSLRNIAKQSEGSPNIKLKNCSWNVSLGYNF